MVSGRATMTYTHLGEMFELLPIYAAALLLGLVSGIVAVHLLTTGTGQLSLRCLLGTVALAALLAGLVAAKPAFWMATVEFWVLAAVVMAVFDLAVSCSVEPWRLNRRFSERSVRRLRLGLPPAILGAVSGALVVLKLQFDLPLNAVLLSSFAAYVIVAFLGLAALDLTIRVAVIGLGRRRMRVVRSPPEFLSHLDGTPGV
jgi:hypothetical protein